MSPTSTPQLVLTNRVANRVLIPLLRGVAGRSLGRRLAVVEYVGGRTGQQHRLVTQYALDGRTVRINVGMPEHKTWWRNFRSPRAVRLRLAGEDRTAVAHVEVDGRAVAVVAALDPPPG
jgi:hypothetical protein